MLTRREAVDFCLEFGDTYEDYPFEDTNWTLMRHKGNNKVFAWIFKRNGHIWINVKGKPEWNDFKRQMFESVVPAYHLNKTHWNSIILDGTVPEEHIKDMISVSHELTSSKRKRQKMQEEKL